MNERASEQVMNAGSDHVTERELKQASKNGSSCEHMEGAPGDVLSSLVEAERGKGAGKDGGVEEV